MGVAINFCGETFADRPKTTKFTKVSRYMKIGRVSYTTRLMREGGGVLAGYYGTFRTIFLTSVIVRRTLLSSEGFLGIHVAHVHAINTEER